MQERNQMNMPFLSSIMMAIIIKYKKHLAIIGLLAAILSAIFSGPLFLTPLYKSTVILFPTASNSISKALLDVKSSSEKDVLEFGEEEQTEQMLQVLNSNKISDRVIEKYNLMEHYEIKPSSKYKMTELYKRYENNFKFRRTEYMAVKIDVYDRDPQLAADMANDIAELVDSTINTMQKKVAVRAYEIVKEEYFSQVRAIQEKEDSLTVLRSFGVHDYESQSEMFNRQLAIEMAKGNEPGIKRLEAKLEVLAKYGGPYVSLRDAVEFDKEQLSLLRAKYEEAKVDAHENLPHKFVVNSAYKAEKKSYPIRWLIVVISIFSALFLSMLVLGLIDTFTEGLKFDLKKKIPSPKPKVKTNLEEQRVVIDNVKENIKEVPIKEEPQTKENKQTENQVRNTREIIDSEMKRYFSSSNLLGLILKWKFHLGVIVVVAGILAAIFSGPTFITPMFKSSAILYPGNVDSYSEESTTEQMLQIMNSQDIVDSVIERFNLAAHYDINPEYKYFQTVLLDEYHTNVSISKTPYESVMIEVKDKDPQRASDMVSAIIELYDNKISTLHKTKYGEVVAMYQNQLASKRANLDSLKGILYELGTKYGIFEYEYQSQEIMRGYLRTLTGQGGSNVNSKEVKRLLKSMEQKSGQLVEVVAMIQEEAISYVAVKEDLEMNERFLYADMTYSNIVSKPFAADKKTYPVRWLIVAMAALAAFVFALLFIFFLESRKDH